MSVTIRPARPDDAAALVPPGDADALARAIRSVLGDPDRMGAMSALNLVAARRYEERVLHARRLAFYTRVRDETQVWEAGRPSARAARPSTASSLP